MTVFMVVSSSLASGVPAHDVTSMIVLWWWCLRKEENGKSGVSWENIIS
jgi:hypothetical protein